MKVWILILTMMLSTAVPAAGSHYRIRVDGLACPYCAYGVEKKLKAIDGVEAIDVDLDEGLVRVDVTEGTLLSEEQLIRLFQDAGFTYRGMEVRER